MEKLRDISLGIYYFGLLGLSVGLAFGNFPISLSQFILAGAWFLYPDYKGKFKRLFSNKVALVLMSLYFLHVVGLLHTSLDFQYALKDLRIKLPLLILPFIIGSMPPINIRKFEILMKVFLASLLVTSFICTAVWLDIIHAEVSNFRDVSIFISHIRYSLLLCIGIFYAAYRSLLPTIGIKERIIMAAVAIWLSAFIFILSSATGIGLFLFCLVISLVIAIFNFRSKLLKFSLLLLLLAIPTYVYIEFHNVYSELMVEVPVDEDSLEKLTAKGNPYVHQTKRPETENGNRTWIYICWEELQEEWEKKMDSDFNGLDKGGNMVKYTLVRYMTSKGLRKDAAGFAMLSNEDLNLIKKGVASVSLQELNHFRVKLYQLVWEFRNYRNGGNPGGHSLTMRFEYWKASLNIIRDAPLVGVGTGDLPKAYEKYYRESNSELQEKWRRRAHNQYLSITATFGLLGLIWFVFALVYPGIALRRFSNYLYFLFFVIISISMFTEDTIESQVGVSIFAFFNTLLLLGVTFNNKPPSESTFS